MKDLIRRVGPCTLAQPVHDPFTLLIRGIISQQISTKAAASIFDRVATVVGGPPIKPASLKELDDTQLAACGLSGAKLRTLRALTTHLEANPKILPGIADRDADVIREQLTAIKGIGPWTVDMFLMFSLLRPDVLPVGDYGLKAGVMRAYGLKELPNAAKLEEIAEPWRPHRTIATWYIWRSLAAVV